MKIFIFFILLLSNTLSASDECQKYIVQNSCEYYKCEEKNHQFGSSGYFISFGHKYCSTFFKDVNPRLSPKGQKWLTLVGKCLQQKLFEEHSYFDQYISKEELTDIAISSHSDCYLETNACSVPTLDLLKVISTFSNELINPKIAKEGIQFLSGCIIN